MSTQITFRRVTRSEWTKLGSSRSTWFTLGVAVVLAVGLAGGIGYGIRRSIDNGGAAPALHDTVEAAFLPMDLLALVIGAFGVLQITSEYSSGLIRTTLASVPRRTPVLLAKALALGTVMAVVMAPTCLLAFVATQAFIGDDGAALGDPGVIRAILGATASTVAIGLLGLGVGAILRHTAGAITTLIIGFLIIPGLLTATLSHRLEDAIMPYVPLVAAQAMYAVGPDNGPFDPLSPLASCVVLTGWIVVLLAAGAIVLNRRDA